MKTVNEAGAESTCLKRVTVCAIYGADDEPLSCESNRCSPPNGICCRLDVSEAKASYSKESSCNWDHAEARAIAKLPVDATPVRAVLFGHNFVCPECEQKLKHIGILDVEVIPSVFGLRN